MPELPRLEWKGSSVSTSSRVISFLKARHMVKKGCFAYLAYVRDTTIESPMIDSVPVVREFTDVFPSDLYGMPPDRDIDFCIDLDLGTQPISIPPYRISLKQLKEQLEELLAKGFVRPNKANVVADAMSRKAKSMGSLAFISAEERPLALDIQSLANRLVSLRERIIEEAHSSQYSIHPVTMKMYSDLRQHYWWRRMKKNIVELTKSAHFIPVVSTYTTERLAHIYIREIVQLHGVPVSIISDRGPQFTSHFWRAIQSELRTHVELSTTFHPQTDRKSEQTVQLLEDMLRVCAIDFGGQWDYFLPLAEFTYNNSYQSSIERTPFEALYGRQCHSPIGWFEPGDALYGIDLVKDALEKLDESLGYEEEPVAIIDRQDCQLRSKRISVVKVQWRGQPVDEVTWEFEEDMQSKCPCLFGTSGSTIVVFCIFYDFP
ncbi:uncharacterized protein [Nicotiana sylvestris]|uniref:uncharacterized protein n=1 Tax=Nicotiana sylvestris TaxID=4096 RepID=UPI00388CA9C3